MKSFEIDGQCFSTLEQFYEQISRELAFPDWWGRNLDALDDVLDDVATQEEGFRLIWRNHELSKQRLGYAETVRQLRLRLERCHPDNRTFVQHQLDDATNLRGPTVFDWLVEILQADTDLRRVDLLLC